MEYLYNASRFVYDAMPELPTLLLLVMFGTGLYILREAAKPGNYWASGFQDEHGKVSMQRVAVLFCFAVMAAIVLMFATRLKAEAITGDFFLWVFGVFGGLWSMSAVAVKLVEAFHAKWTK